MKVRQWVLTRKGVAHEGQMRRGKSEEINVIGMYYNICI